MWKQILIFVCYLFSLSNVSRFFQANIINLLLWRGIALKTQLSTIFLSFASIQHTNAIAFCNWKFVDRQSLFTVKNEMKSSNTFVLHCDAQSVDTRFNLWTLSIVTHRLHNDWRTIRHAIYAKSISVKDIFIDDSITFADESFTTVFFYLIRFATNLVSVYYRHSELYSVLFTVISLVMLFMGEFFFFFFFFYWIFCFV